VLEVTVYDEDKDMKKEFIGKVAIPLIMVSLSVFCVTIDVITSLLH